MITISTDHTIAFNSIDHLYPEGVKKDNHTSLEFIQEAEQIFGNPLTHLDLGCAGGQLVADFNSRGHLSVGLEGSDYALKNDLFNWPALYGKRLFNCDVRYPFTVKNDGGNVLFDLITAWELIEHLEAKDFKSFFNNVINHLKPDGLFICSIHLHYCTSRDGVEYHRSVFSESTWYTILPSWFVAVEFPFRHLIRPCDGSLILAMKKK